MDQFTATGNATTPPAGRRLYAEFKAQIDAGQLRPGALLPSTRALALERGLSRTTVTAVYEQLAAEGFIHTAPGRRAAVAPGLAQSPAPAVAVPAQAAIPRWSALGQRVQAQVFPPVADAAPPRIAFVYGALAGEDFPRLVWRKAMQQVLRQRPSTLAYAAPEGEAVLRRALQAYLQRTRGLVCTAEQIVIVQGSQQAIDLCARLLLDPGDVALVEDPCYLMARRVFEAVGAQVQAVPVDAQGLLTEQLPPHSGARLVYVTPSHQFPLGGVLPAPRRQALLQWAQAHQAYVLEDDYDGEFRYGQRPIDALQALDAHGRVLYIGTFSKALSPQLRLGYLVLPPALVDGFRRLKRLSDRHAPLAEQLALAALLDSGGYERHVRRMRRSHERRRQALLQALAQHLPGALVQGTVAGLHVVAWLPGLDCQDEPALVARARALGVGVAPVTPLYAQQQARQPGTAGLVLGYASLDAAQIREGLALLGALVAQMVAERRAAP